MNIGSNYEAKLSDKKCNDVFGSLSSHEEYPIGTKLIKLYKDLSVDEFCKKNKVLNVCVIDSQGNQSYIRHTVGADNSTITGVFDQGETIGLYHWGGFVTKLDKDTLDFIDQSFTK